MSDQDSAKQLTLHLSAARLPAGLYVGATPIGHAKDITLRLLEALMGADIVACEDTRMTAKLLGLYGLKRPLVPYHDHNGAEMRPRLLKAMGEGQSVLLVSDAGTPLVSDPGFKLVADTHEAGFAVTALPGPSAVLAGLVVGGLSSDQFHFAGFLPPKEKARRDRLQSLGAVPGTLIFYETAPRLRDSLSDMALCLGGDRMAVVVRELTKKFEERRADTLENLAAHYADAGAPKGEIVVLVGEAPIRELAEQDVDAMLIDALGTMKVKDAAAAIALETGLPKRDLYQKALALKDNLG